MPGIPQYERTVKDTFQQSYRRTPSTAEAEGHRIQAQAYQHKAYQIRTTTSLITQGLQLAQSTVQMVEQRKEEKQDFLDKLYNAEAKSQALMGEVKLKAAMAEFAAGLPMGGQDDPTYLSGIPESWDEYKKQVMEGIQADITNPDGRVIFEQKAFKWVEEYDLKVESFLWDATVDESRASTKAAYAEAIKGNNIEWVKEILKEGVTDLILSAEEAGEMLRDAGEQIKFQEYVKQAMTMPVDEAVKFLNNIQNTPDLTRAQRNEIISAVNRLKGLEASQEKTRHELSQDVSYQQVIADLEVARDGKMSYEVIRGRLASGGYYADLEPEQNKAFIADIDRIAREAAAEERRVLAAEEKAEKKEKAEAVEAKKEPKADPTIESEIIRMMDDPAYDRTEIRTKIYDEHAAKNITNADFTKYKKMLDDRRPDIAKQEINSWVEDNFKEMEALADAKRFGSDKAVQEVREGKAEVMKKLHDYFMENPDVSDAEKWEKAREIMEPYTRTRIGELMDRVTGERKEKKAAEAKRIDITDKLKGMDATGEDEGGNPVKVLNGVWYREREQGKGTVIEYWDPDNEEWIEL